MNAEDQFWWNWGVQALLAAGTFLAVVVALFGDRLRYLLQPPKLRLELVTPAGECVPVGVKSPNGEVRQTYARYYHLKVLNERRWSSATDAQVFLTSIEEPDAVGENRLVWAGEVPFKWQHAEIRGIQPRSLGSAQIVDLCNVVQSNEMGLGKWVELDLLFTPSGIENPRRNGFKLVLGIQAKSKEVDSNVLRLEIAWDGKWADGNDEMKRHLVVQRIAET